MPPVIAYLADHPDAVPDVARWWFEQWGPTSPGGSLEEMTDKLRSTLDDDELPVTIIAMIDGEVVGSASLKLHAMKTLRCSRT